MAKHVKVRYDKALKKYHIEYQRIKEMSDYRFKTFQTLNASNDLFILIETHLGSINKPDPLSYTRTFEGLLAKYSLSFNIRPVEIPSNKNFLGMFPAGKKTITHYAITFIVPSGRITRDLFDQLLCEFDLQVGYKMQRSSSDYFEDLQKGYISGVFGQEDFKDNFYDSRIFDKFLATEDISAL